MAGLSDAVTTAKVKEYFGIPVANTSKDAIIAAMIPKAIAFVCLYCRHDFESKARTSEVLIVEDEDKRAFAQFRPIASITSVVEDGTELVSGTDYYCHKNTGCFQRLNATWDSTPGNIVVTYTGGDAYTDDVVQVCMEIVGIYAGLKVRTYVTNEGVEQAVTVTSVPEELKKILDLHKYVEV